MSSTSRWGDSRSLASTLLSFVRPQSSPPRDVPASSDAPSSSTKKQKNRNRRDHEHHQRAQDDNNDAMTTDSQELPPLRNDREAGESPAEFGALEVFDSNAAVASSQAIEPASSNKKNRRDKKDRSSTKSQRRAHRRSSSTNGHDDADEPAVTPASPSRKKRKNSDFSDGTGRKKRKSHAAIDSIPEEQANPELPNSPFATRSHLRGLSGDVADLNGIENDEIERDVKAVAREAWQEHINTQATQQQDTEMTDSAAVSAEISAEASVEPTSEVPAAEAPFEDPVQAPAGEATSTPQRPRSTRKRSKPTYFDQPVTDASLDVYGQLPSPSAMTPKPRRAKKAAPKKGSRSQRKAERETDFHGDGAPKLNVTLGKFSDEELSRVAHAVESFRAEYDMEQRDMIQAPGGTSAGEAHAQLWLRIFAECPDRRRQKVINVARKRFHNFVARGTWTAEQDTELAGLYNTHGNKWSMIGGMINRHPEDCRDRFRNYLVCGGAQKKEAWTDEEEASLTHHIQNAMLTIDQMRKETPTEELLKATYEELVDWQQISERMAHTRSRLQCLTKWKAMNMRIHSKDKFASADPDSNISFRLDKARRQLEDMPDTEKYRLVLAIKSLSASSVAKIPWQKLCDKHFRSLWHRHTQELVWSRLVKSVPGSESRTVRECAQYLADKYDQDGGLPNIGGEGWDDEEEMELVSQVPVGKKEIRADVSAEKLTQEDMQGDGQELDAETQEMHIDPALNAFSEVPQSAQKATPAKRTQNGKRPSGRKPRRPVEPIEESADIVADGGEANGDDIDESSHHKRKTPSKFKKGRITKAPVEPSSDMDDMEDLPSRVEAE